MALVSMADVAEAARTVLVADLPAQVAALTRPLPAPSSYDLVPDAEHIRRVKGVALAISVAGLAEPPSQTGGEVYRAKFVLSIAAFVQNSKTTPLLTAPADYAAAVRATVLQSGGLDGFASDLDWTAESNDLMTDEQTGLTLGFAVTEFTVAVDDVVDPNSKPGLPPGGGPLVQTTDVQFANHEESP